MSRRTAALAALVLAALFAMTACDPIPQEGIALSRHSGDVIIRFELCPGDRVTGVSLRRSVGDVVGDADDEVLWEIHADEPSTESVFVIGRTPASFTEVTPFSTPLQQSDLVFADVDTVQLGDYLSFRGSQLREDSLLTIDGYVSREEFVTQAAERCDS